MDPLTEIRSDDVLSELLRSTRVRSSVYCRSDMTAPWGFRVEANAVASFHLVRDGGCWLEVQGADRPVRLESGDLVILPRGHAHQVRSDLSYPVTALEDILSTHPVTDGCRLHYGGGGDRTELLCGGFVVEERADHPMLAALPPVMHIKGQEERPPAWLDATLKLLLQEMATPSPGTEAIVTRLTEVLLTQAIRAYAPDHDAPSPTRLAVLGDQQVSAALRLMREHPARRWTVDDLAGSVAMSRSAFSARFRSVTGDSPMRYLARCRLARAAEYLRTGSQGLIEIAMRTGYESDVSLSKAFRRHFGTAPGAYRKTARQGVP